MYMLGIEETRKRNDKKGNKIVHDFLLQSTLLYHDHEGCNARVDDEK